MKPLRLKREVYLQPGEITEYLPLAKVLVDSGVAHLDQPYNYLIPKKFENQLQTGSFVEVDFAGKGRTGLVLARLSMADEATTSKTILKPIGRFPIITNEILDLASQTANHFAGDIFSVLRSAIPQRVESVEKKLSKDLIDWFAHGLPIQKESLALKASTKPAYLPLSDYSQIRRRIEQLLSEGNSTSQVLLVVPDLKELVILGEELSQWEPTFLTSDLTKSERFTNYLQTLIGRKRLIIGTRSAIFAPLIPGSHIMVFNDQDPSMYEKRNPYWNVRDVALMRSDKHNLSFISSSPSLEILTLLERKVITTVEVKSIFKERKLRNFNPKLGESYLSAIKSGLLKGNVLVTINDPGYVSTLACGNCRNIARCNCGGKLVLQKGSNEPTCAVCQKDYFSWRCEWCKSDRKRMVTKGSERLGEELAKSFPNVLILISKAKSRIDKLPDLSENALVISTYGCEPQGEYASYVGLNLEFAFAGTQLRSYEAIRLTVVDNFLKVKMNGEVFLELPNDHPFIQTQLSGSFSKDLNLELESRNNAMLPPSFQIATVTGVHSEIRELQAQISNIDFFANEPIFRSLSDNSELVIKSKVSQDHQLPKFLCDLRRYRSLKKLKPLDIRVSPYNL
jgi:primosomal protein N' (replication factor Y) (superfamily II helicase)